MMAPDGPLGGIRVVDLTQSVAGPYCTMLLADLGAQVIKVERPGLGDDTRSWTPPTWGDESTTFLTLNRNKRSVALDFKAPLGRRVLWELIKQSDVLVQNLRPGALAKAGFGYRAVADVNPKLVYCSITAYGAVGPMAGLPGYDPLMQAYGGLMSVTGEPGRSPVRVGTSIMDMGTGLWALIGVLSALRMRDQSGEGRLVETSLYETAIAWMAPHIASYLGTGDIPEAYGSGTAMLAPYEAYPTADGELIVAAGNDGLWQRLCQVIEAEELTLDPRFLRNAERVNNRGALFAELGEIFKKEPTAAWISKLSAVGVPCAPVRSVDEVVADTQTEAIGMLRPLDHPHIPDYQDVGIPVSWDAQRPSPRWAPPQLGQDTSDVLSSLGLDAAEIDAVCDEGMNVSRSSARAAN